MPDLKLIFTILPLEAKRIKARSTFSSRSDGQTRYSTSSPSFLVLTTAGVILISPS